MHPLQVLLNHLKISLSELCDYTGLCRTPLVRAMTSGRGLSKHEAHTLWLNYADDFVRLGIDPWDLLGVFETPEEDSAA